MKKINVCLSIILLSVILSGCSSSQEIHDKAYQEGYNAAIQEVGSYEDGYNTGYSEGHTAGVDECQQDYDKAYDNGYQIGYKDGFDAGKGETSPDDSYYVLNTSSKKFHLPSCSGVSAMSSNNMRISYDDRQTIIDEGYKPCKECNP